ncbi:MAG: hypothetical protein ACKO9H_20745, partial [Planctomycetota bacterium]
AREVVSCRLLSRDGACPDQHEGDHDKCSHGLESPDLKMGSDAILGTLRAGPSAKPTERVCLV